MADYRRNYDDDRSSRWEGPRDDRRYVDYGYPGASTGAYRTDIRTVPTPRANTTGRPGISATTTCGGAPKATALNGSDEGRGRDEGPSWGRRERGGYWRQYDRPLAQSPYYGRGPKDYQRSDDRVREEVCDAMTDDPLLDASEIIVTVAHGEVTLSGSVTTRDQKRRAEDVAERISGVRDVTNQLRVAQPSGHGHSATQPVSQASGQGTPSKSSGTSA